VIAVVGGSKGDLAPLYEQGLTAAFSINRLPQLLEESAPHTAENLEYTMDNILRLLEVGR
jgi:glycerate kinase